MRDGSGVMAVAQWRSGGGDRQHQIDICSGGVVHVVWRMWCVIVTVIDYAPAHEEPVQLSPQLLPVQYAADSI